jgi:sarcosine oxidase subunit alpha
VDIKGRERVEGVTIAQVDENRRPVPGTEREIECDTLLLSVGLIPENELSLLAGVKLSAITAGPVVDQALHTNVPGIFAAGNVLHVHDLVDYVSQEAEQAGKNAAGYAKSPAEETSDAISVEDGFGVSGCVPQLVRRESMGDKPLRLMFRPRDVYKGAAVVVELDGKRVYRKKHLILAPGEIATADIEADKLRTPGTGKITVRLEVG